MQQDDQEEEVSDGWTCEVVYKSGKRERVVPKNTCSLIYCPPEPGSRPSPEWLKETWSLDLRLVGVEFENSPGTPFNDR